MPLIRWQFGVMCCIWFVHRNTVTSSKYRCMSKLSFSALLIRSQSSGTCTQLSIQSVHSDVHKRSDQETYLVGSLSLWLHGQHPILGSKMQTIVERERNKLKLGEAWQDHESWINNTLSMNRQTDC
jgi:hypothetical protein